MDKRTDIEPNQLYIDHTNEKLFYLTDDKKIVWLTEEEAAEKFGKVEARRIPKEQVEKQDEQ